jgi:Cu/Ag efflux pump CusA
MAFHRNRSALVTRPIEAAINGAPDLASMRSESIAGLSVISLSFSDKADPHIARQGVAERVNALGTTLPAGAGTPELSPLVSSTMDLLKIGLTSDKLDPYALRDTADWELKPQLLAVPGWRALRCSAVRCAKSRSSRIWKAPPIISA